MSSLLAIKTQQDDFEVQYEVLSPVIGSTVTNPYQLEIAKKLESVDAQLELCEKKAAELNKEIDRLTNHADGLDYTIAVASGVLTGLIDSFFVGEVDLQECHKWGSDKVNDFVKKVGGDDDLSKAIANLEKKSKAYFASDPNLNDFGGGLQHHLRDFAHHPTLVGLVFSLLTQFTNKCYGTNTAGLFTVVPVKDKTRIGDTVTKKIIYGTVFWFIHLVSDIAGTNLTAGGGTGLPGPILSLAKELSSIPIFNKIKVDDIELSKFISKLFNGTYFAKRDSAGKIIKETVVPIDLRTELGVLRKQAFPVVLNEIIVRVFYAARRFGMEAKAKHVQSFADLSSLDWGKIIPFRNRTVVRMMTIAAGTFTAVDMADAAIRSGGFNAACLLRVNFVGVGRFAIAIVTDTAMGVKRSKLQKEKFAVVGEQLDLLNVKVSYLYASAEYGLSEALEEQSQLWISAENTVSTLMEANDCVVQAIDFYKESLQEISENLRRITGYMNAVEQKNPGLTQEMLDTIKWGGL